MDFNRDYISLLLLSDDKLIEKGHQSKLDSVGGITYLRGLIELSNICVKRCYYCGIRKDNEVTTRYTLSNKQVLDAAKYAYDNNYGSIAIQAGERIDGKYIDNIVTLLREIKDMSNGELGITLSLGEQSNETFKKWREAGADRYLLRIETSNKELYNRLHPNDNLHSFDKRITNLKMLRDNGYQVGTGVMIGLPWQTKEHLIDDLIFLRDMDIDMCGMGPYLEHSDTPLYIYKDALWSKQERFDTTIRMIATLRLMMPQINIAATTALQAIDPLGREKALWAGANVIMPNITPVTTRASYKLYENKPISEDCLDIQDKSLFERILKTGDVIGFGKQGNSIHYKNSNRT